MEQGKGVFAKHSARNKNAPLKFSFLKSGKIKPVLDLLSADKRTQYPLAFNFFTNNDDQELYRIQALCMR